MSLVYYICYLDHLCCVQDGLLAMFGRCGQVIAERDSEEAFLILGTYKYAVMTANFPLVFSDLAMDNISRHHSLQGV